MAEHHRYDWKSDDGNPRFSLSRWRERVGVRVVSKYIPLTLILSPRGEELRRCAHF